MADGHNGFFVALWLTPKAAAQLARPGGEDASNLHITLAYCADVDVLGEAVVASARDAVAGVAAEQAPLEGVTGGMGRFAASPSSDAKDVVICLPDVPGLSAFRERIVAAITAVGAPPRTEHGWTPHISIAYVAPDAPEQARVPSVPLRFDEVVVVVGEERFTFPFVAGRKDLAVGMGQRWAGHTVGFPPERPVEMAKRLAQKIDEKRLSEALGKIGDASEDVPEAGDEDDALSATEELADSALRYLAMNWNNGHGPVMDVLRHAAVLEFGLRDVSLKPHGDDPFFAEGGLREGLLDSPEVVEVCRAALRVQYDETQRRLRGVTTPLTLYRGTASTRMAPALAGNNPTKEVETSVALSGLTSWSVDQDQAQKFVGALSGPGRGFLWTVRASPEQVLALPGSLFGTESQGEVLLLGRTMTAVVAPSKRGASKSHDLAVGMGRRWEGHVREPLTPIDPATLPSRQRVPLENVVARVSNDPVVIPGLGMLPPDQTPVYEGRVKSGEPVIVYRVVPESSLIRTAKEGEFYSRKTFTASNEGRTQVALDPVPLAGWRLPGRTGTQFLVQLDIQGAAVRVPKSRMVTTGDDGTGEAIGDSGLGIGVEDKLPVSRVLRVWAVEPHTNLLTPVALEDFKDRPSPPPHGRPVDELLAEAKVAKPDPVRVRDAVRAKFPHLRPKFIDETLDVAAAVDNMPQPLSAVVARVRAEGVAVPWAKANVVVGRALERLREAGVVTATGSTVGRQHQRYRRTDAFTLAAIPTEFWETRVGPELEAAEWGWRRGHNLVPNLRQWVGYPAQQDRLRALATNHLGEVVTVYGVDDGPVVQASLTREMAASWGGAVWCRTLPVEALLLRVQAADQSVVVDLAVGMGKRWEGHIKKSDEEAEADGSAITSQRWIPREDVSKRRLTGLGLPIPPAWFNVRINANPRAALQVVAEYRRADGEVETKYLYSVAHTKKANATKHRRIREFVQELPELRRKIREGLKSDDPRVRDAAAILAVMDKTGFRIGGNADTGAEKKAFGVSTLRQRHVEVRGDRVAFSFGAKSGQRVRRGITDPELAEIFRERRGDDPRAPIFKADAGAVREFLHSIDGKFVPKDFRTRVALSVAVEAVKRLKVPTDEAEFKLAQRHVAKVVAKALGNTPAVALKHYIDPTVFSAWHDAAPKAMALSVRDDDEPSLAEWLDTIAWTDELPDWRDEPEEAEDDPDSVDPAEAYDLAVGMGKRWEGHQKQERAAAFSRWFGKSKVVDERGLPLRVYHGTTKDILVFGPSKKARAPLSHLGFYFTPDPALASAFTRRNWASEKSPTKLRGNVVPVYLSLQNPKVLSAYEWMQYSNSSPARIQSVRADFERDGHDGIIVKRLDPDPTGELHVEQYIAFRPEQIKSAVGNRGTFDPESPDISLADFDLAVGMGKRWAGHTAVEYAAGSGKSISVSNLYKEGAHRTFTEEDLNKVIGVRTPYSIASAMLDGIPGKFEAEVDWVTWEMAPPTPESDIGEFRVILRGGPFEKVERHFLRLANGALTVLHDDVQVRDEVQGAGAAMLMIDNSLRLYKQMADRVTVKTFANKNVGGYAWARAGFLPHADSMAELVKDLTGRVQGLAVPPKVKDTLQALVDNIAKEPKSLWFLADARWNGRNLGKTLLMGTSYRADLNLNDDAQMARWNKYITARLKGEHAEGQALKV